MTTEPFITWEHKVARKLRNTRNAGWLRKLLWNRHEKKWNKTIAVDCTNHRWGNLYGTVNTGIPRCLGCNMSFDEYAIEKGLQPMQVAHERQGIRCLVCSEIIVTSDELDYINPNYMLVDPVKLHWKAHIKSIEREL